MAWYHLAIRDRGVPAAEFESRWTDVGGTLRGLLSERRDVLIHCLGGLGRSGMIAARLLVELGEAPRDANRARASCAAGRDRDGGARGVCAGVPHGGIVRNGTSHDGGDPNARPRRTWTLLRCPGATELHERKRRESWTLC